MVKTNKTGSKVVSAHRGSEIPSTVPQRGHGFSVASTQRSPVSPTPHQKLEAVYPGATHSTSDSRSFFPQSGPGLSGIPISRGTEARSKSDGIRYPSPHRKSQQIQTTSPQAVHMQRNIGPARDEGTRRGGESKLWRDNIHTPSSPDVKSSRRLSFIDQKDNLQFSQDENPPSKVQYPQGIRVPRRPLVHPKDEAVQTDPIRKNLTAAESRAPRGLSSPRQGSSKISADSRAVHRRTLGPESEMSHPGSPYIEPKNYHRNMKLDSSLRLSVLKDLDGPRVRTEAEYQKYPVLSETKSSPKFFVSPEMDSSMRSSVRGDCEAGRRVTISPGAQSVQGTHRVTSRAMSESPPKFSMGVTVEPTYKQPTPRAPEIVSTSPPSVQAELELTPRPLPPRSLPKYGPDSSWWALLNPEAETPQSRPATPDFEFKYYPPLDPFLCFREMDSNPCYEDLMFQKEKASPSPPPAPAMPPPPAPPKESRSWVPMREVPQASKHISKEPIERSSAFFLGVSEEMHNRVLWWLKGLCFSLYDPRGISSRECQVGRSLSFGDRLKHPVVLRRLKGPL
ncbi:PREDICTED: uncharacterized protein C17orf47 homolog [Condylura cristata]|uniref:uncharacterized protein C17orf47 homolog n=1 Tax=Condylura cristata TaxID=143302 RepID=UPI0006436FA7|nr:PREDICTED: uncharacterized protein C17orf47 homolog [Condylura cristata]